MKNIGTYIIYFFLGVFAIISCSQNKKFVPEEKFIGVWQLEGREMYDGIRIAVQSENGKIKGRIRLLNRNKVVNMFCDSNSVWISNIKRVSNFEFKVSEKRPAAELMSIYGIGATQEYKAVFIHDDTIGLSIDPSDPFKSIIRYVRVKP